jgi:hypothetical protein
MHSYYATCLLCMLVTSEHVFVAAQGKTNVAIAIKRSFKFDQWHIPHTPRPLQNQRRQIITVKQNVYSTYVLIMHTACR